MLVRNLQVLPDVATNGAPRRASVVQFKTHDRVTNIMKTLNQILALAGVTTLLAVGTGSSTAQERQDRPGRGNFDPEQMRARMMENYREKLEVKEDAEWKLIEGRITKVSDARREMGGGQIGRASCRERV